MGVLCSRLWLGLALVAALTLTACPWELDAVDEWEDDLWNCVVEDPDCSTATTCEEDFDIHYCSQYQALVFCDEVVGDVLIERSSLPRIDLPCLDKVDGQVSISSNGEAAEILMPNLRRAPAGVVVTFNGVSRLDLSRLESVPGLYLEANYSLTSLDLSSLSSLEGSMFIASHDALPSFSIPGLVTIGGGVYLHDNESVATLTLPELTTIDSSLRITGNDSLRHLTGFASLESVWGDLEITKNTCLDQAEVAQFVSTLNAWGSVETELNGASHPCN